MPVSYCEPAIVAASLKCKAGTLVWYCCTSSWATTLDIDVLNICCLQICTWISPYQMYHRVGWASHDCTTWISITTSRPSLVVWGKVCVCMCVCVCVCVCACVCVCVCVTHFSALYGFSFCWSHYLCKLAHLYGIDHEQMLQRTCQNQSKLCMYIHTTQELSKQGDLGTEPKVILVPLCCCMDWWITHVADREKGS